MKTLTSRTGSSRGGFTLIELLAVVFILGLVAAVIAPVFSSPSDTLRKEASVMASAVRSLSEAAEARKMETSMSFDFANSTASWLSPSGNHHDMELETLRGVELVSRGMVSEGQLRVFWSPSGMNEHMRVHLENGGRRAEVEYNPISGKVTVSDHANER